MLLSWDELPEIDRNGIIIVYEVAYVPLVDCNTILPGAVSGSGDYTQLMVDGLEENTAYIFSVRAYTIVW